MSTKYCLFFIISVLISLPSHAKRKAPKPVSSIISGNYVYTVPHWSHENGTNQNGGYIQVLDTKTGNPIWGIQVYKTSYEQSQESDVQDVFITSTELNFWGNKLKVTNELGHIYTVDLKNKAVSSVE
ncbi:hypothetical protein [Pseudoalteromonas sp. Of7M-16]|uniref:hypothetical protein n=1 Tax=Pseudoalteromonas sp. Of7M-16 TaxID=2917756 RepID=UPI001EF541BE|nr:hypothetical protein [Pseudoalteromonas sp. Of7M-16]MCG7549256.1 hypothetical protein [Pseudoalteromonas sp. Of7M-16]